MERHTGPNAGDRWGLRAALMLSMALACLLGGVGCEEEPEVANDDSVAGSYQALAAQLQNCASSALTCLQNASCDEAQEQECRDEFRACREGTRDAYRAYHEAVRVCWHDKFECVRDAWSADASTATGEAGTSAFDACKDTFRECVAADRPIPPEPGPCMSGLRACVETNVQWGEDASRQAFRDCLGEAHACIVDRIPMCGPDDPGADDDAGVDGQGQGDGSRRRGGDRR
jgi:hypothetical protein